MSELNREQIIKALECCCGDIVECQKCAYVKNGYNRCKERASQDALSLINELTEENERLRERADRHLENLKAVLDERSESNIEADTVRKMQERFSILLKKEYEENTPEGASFYFKNGALMMWSIADRVFAQIAKEMLEENNGNN